MEHFCKPVLFTLVLKAVLHNSLGEKKWFWGKKPSSKKPSVKPSQETKTQPPRQPFYPDIEINLGYPNQQSPGRGGSNLRGYPNQNHGAGSYRSTGGSPNQYPDPNHGGYPNQNPSYDQFMDTCMKQRDLLKEQNRKESAVHNNIHRDEPLADYLGTKEGFLKKGVPEKNDTNWYPKDAGIYENEGDDTVNIEQIGYPALTEQMKAQKFFELYLVYSEVFPEMEEKKSNHNKSSSNHNGHCVSGVLLFLITSIMLVRST